MFDLLNEPLHLHVVKEKNERTYAAKIWLETLEFERKGSLTKKECNLIIKLIAKNKAELINLCNKAKAGQQVKALHLKF